MAELGNTAAGYDDKKGEQVLVSLSYDIPYVDSLTESVLIVK